MCMLTEQEIRNWRQRDFERLTDIVDPDEKRCGRIAVAVLDGVLND